MDHNMSRSRGVDNESLVGKALQAIRDRRKSAIPPIEKIVHARPNSNLDRCGVDFLVELKGGQEIPLQVKSSDRGRRKFEKRCRKLGLSIPVIVVNVRESLEKIIYRIIKTIKLILNVAQREINKKRHLINIKLRRKSKRDRFRRDFAFAWCH